MSWSSTKDKYGRAVLSPGQVLLRKQKAQLKRQALIANGELDVAVPCTVETCLCKRKFLPGAMKRHAIERAAKPLLTPPVPRELGALICVLIKETL